MFSSKRKEVTFVLLQISYLKIVRSVWIPENLDFEQESTIKASY